MESHYKKTRDSRPRVATEEVVAKYNDYDTTVRRLIGDAEKRSQNSRKLTTTTTSRSLVAK